MWNWEMWKIENDNFEFDFKFHSYIFTFPQFTSTLSIKYLPEFGIQIFPSQ